MKLVSQRRRKDSPRLRPERIPWIRSRGRVPWQYVVPLLITAVTAGIAIWAVSAMAHALRQLAAG